MQQHVGWPTIKIIKRSVAQDKSVCARTSECQRERKRQREREGGKEKEREGGKEKERER